MKEDRGEVQPSCVNTGSRRSAGAAIFVVFAGLLDLSLTAANMQHSQASASAMLLLRNLALAPENKVHFVANPRALPVLLGAAGKAGQNAEAGAHAAAALWALVHQGEKVCPSGQPTCCKSSAFQKAQVCTAYLVFLKHSCASDVSTHNWRNNRCCQERPRR